MTLNPHPLHKKRLNKLNHIIICLQNNFVCIFVGIMTKLPKIITIMLALLITFACDEQNCVAEYTEKLALAEKLLDTQPDSVVSILRGINIDNISDPTQAAKAHYLYGTAKRMLLDYPEAMRALLYAEKGAEESNNYQMLADTRRQIMTLHDSTGNDIGRAKYALKMADAYEALCDSDNVFDILDFCRNEFISLKDFNTAKEVSDRMEKMFRNSKDTINMLSPESYIYITSKEYISQIQLPMIKQLRDSISAGGNWRDVIKCDTITHMPNSIRMLANNLFEEGQDSLACQLLECFCKYYTCTELGNHADAGIISLTKKFNAPFPFNGTLLTRKNFFSRDIPAVERIVQYFYYEEIVIKEQTIRHQREMLVAVVIGCVLVICITVLIFRIINARRRRREEILIQSAAELKRSLSHTHDKWLGTLTKLCDTYYDAYAKQSAKSKIAKAALDEINRAIDAPEFFTSLEQRVDREHDGVMTLMREEIPGLRDDEYRLLMLNALGYSVPTLALLMHESRDLIYTRRVRLRSKIQELAPHHTDLFLKALE